MANGFGGEEGRRGGGFGSAGGPGGSRGDEGGNPINAINAIDPIGNLVGRSITEDPITQAARIQAEAIEQGIDLFQPFLQAGTGALPGFQQGATPQGLDEMLAQIFSGESFQNLIGERRRGVEGQLAAGGLTRSGAGVEAAANIPTELGFALEQLLRGRQGELVDLGRESTFNVANLLSSSAEATASGILGLEESRQQRSSDRSSNITDLVGLGISAFSDPLLKENIREIRKIGPLTLVQWDWRPEVQDTIVVEYPNVGFLSTEVREVYPDLVSKFGGFDLINYGELVERLSCH